MNWADAWDHHDFALPHITPATLTEALEGFAPSRCHGKDSDWLAVAVRRSLGMTLKHISDRPERQSNADTRKELQRLSLRVGKVWAALFAGRSSEAEDAIWRYSLRHWDGEGGEDIGNGLVMGDPTELRRFQTALAELSWLSGFLKDVAREIPSQPPRWTQAEWREIRIERGQYLAPIYEAAFKPNRLTAVTFGDFYQRMVSLAFEEGDIPDFEALIAEIRQRHFAAPVVFGEGVIPGL